MGDGKPFHNPFGALSSGQAKRPEQAAAAAPVDPRPASVDKTGKAIPRAVISFERAGRGGKTVTVVSHLGIAPAALAAWLKDLKAALGCGGVIEGDTIVLQGDHRARLPDLLRARGVKRV